MRAAIHRLANIKGNIENRETYCSINRHLVGFICHTSFFLLKSSIETENMSV